MSEEVKALMRYARTTVNRKSIETGDKIWYRRKGETYIHVNYVDELRDRVIAVREHQSEHEHFIHGRKVYWLDRDEIEIIDIEKPD